MKFLADIGNTLCALVGIGLLLVVPSATADQLDTVTLQLKWQHQFQFAGYYAAQEKGFYREKGLDVRFVEATPETNVVDEVTGGRAEYGVGNSALLLARHAGKPVVTLAAIFQHSALMLYGHVYSGISSIQDIKGKRVMLEPNSEELLAYLRREKIPENTLTIIPHAFSTDELVLGHVDAISGYSTSEPFYLDKSYIPYVALSPRSAGIDFYGDNLFTSEGEIRNNPARVKAFREASLKGWEYALAHPQEIADIILNKYTARHSREYLLFEAERMKPLISSDLLAIGYMHSDRWQHIINTYAELGLMDKNFALDKFLYINNSEEERKQERLKWTIGLVIAGAIGILATIIATLMLRLNRRMKREMAAREKAVSELRESESKFRFLAENTGDVIWILDIASGRFTYVSPSVYELRGYTQEEIMRQPMKAALTPESAERARTVLENSIARWNAGDHTQPPRVTEIDQPHKDGHIVHTEVVTTLHADASGKPAHVIGVTRNITERKRAEEVIRRLAFYDPLTELANRRLLLDRLPQQIARARRDQSLLAILYIDLDKFKPINDQLGHETGDWLLKSAADRLLAGLRQSDTAARIGGDEFVILLPDIQHTEQALSVAKKICSELQRPFVTPEGKSLTISSSIGVAIYPEHSNNEQDLLRMADEAMYRAKKSGSGRVELFSSKDGGEDYTDDIHHVIHLEWRPSFASYHPAIDHQHRELFRRANALLDASPAGFNQAFDALLAHVETHFADEEEILRNNTYDALAEHIAKHRELTEKAMKLRHQLSERKISTGELVDFLARDVVAKHMLQEDRKFFALFAKNERAAKNV